MTPEAVPAAARAGDSGSFQAFGEDGFTFADFIDIINPLQHIPIVATIYRAMTGDEIDPGARVAGGALFGGPIGAVAATANAFLDETTGKDVGEHVLAFLGVNDESDAPVAIASAESAQTGLPDLGALAPLPALKPTPAIAQAPSPLELSALAPLSPITPSLAVMELSALPKMKDEPDEKQPERDAQPNGAVAPAGGWFSEAMLSALHKYEASALLAQPTAVQPTLTGTY